jgi:hypothetical protein
MSMNVVSANHRHDQDRPASVRQKRNRVASRGSHADVMRDNLGIGINPEELERLVQ